MAETDVDVDFIFAHNYMTAHMAAQSVFSDKAMLFFSDHDKKTNFIHYRVSFLDGAQFRLVKWVCNGRLYDYDEFLQLIIDALKRDYA